MSIKRTILALTAVAVPLVACGSSASRESLASLDEAYIINPRLQCAAGAQAGHWWGTSEKTMDDSVAWYPTPMTAPGPAGLTYVAFAGMTPGSGTVDNVAWVPQGSTGSFEEYNPTCYLGSGSGPSRIPYVSQSSGENGGGTSTRCPPLSIANFPLPTTCVTVGTVDSFADMNYCPQYVDVGTAFCTM